MTGSTRSLVHFAARHLFAAVLIWTGMYKVFPTAYPPPEPDIWIRPYGEQSLCELMHTWVGFAPRYVIVLGVVEVMSAVLLLFRRTTTFGALVGTISLINIALLELGYYCGLAPALPALVGVALGAYLMHTDRDRILDFLLRNRSTQPSHPEPEPPAPHARLAVRTIGALLLLYPCFYLPVRRWLEHVPVSPLAGVYRVQTLTRNGASEPLVYENPDRWILLAIDRHARTASIRTLGDERFSVAAANLRLSHRGADSYQLQAKVDNDSVVADLKRMDPEKLEFSVVFGLGYSGTIRRWGY
jgi:hypothetical protein